MADRKSGKPRASPVASSKKSRAMDSRHALADATARVSDQAGRLVGEDAHNATAEEAAHWVAVYSELLSFKAELLEITARRRLSLSLDARGEAEADEVVIAAQAGKYTRRLREWRAHVDTTMIGNGSATLALFVEGRARTFGHLLIDPWKRMVVNGGQPQQLTTTEWRLLRILLEHVGETLTRAQLAAGVWPGGVDTALGKVDVYISRLRCKLESAAGGAAVIETVRGSGYLLTLPLEVDDPLLGASRTRRRGNHGVSGSRESDDLSSL